MSEACPFCGKPILRVGFSSAAGKREESLCCNIPLEFIDNDGFAGLPEDLQQIAIDCRRAEYAAMDEQDREDARRYKEVLDRRLLRRHAHLVKGEY